MKIKAGHCLLALLLVAQGALAQPVKSVLLVFAHPDDEVMIRSFTARLIEMGNQVSAVYLTRGEGGRDQRSESEKSADLATTRSKELTQASTLYGFKHLYIIGVPDNPLRDPLTHVPSRDASLFTGKNSPWDLKEIKTQFAEIGKTEHPQIVITFFPSQPETHAHHRATAELVRSQYEGQGFGPSTQGLFGFYEEPVVSGAKATPILAQPRMEFSPLLLSPRGGPNRGKPYGEVGTIGALAHVSQLKGDTGNYIRNWKTNPPEKIATIDSPTGLAPLQEALGDLNGLVMK